VVKANFPGLVWTYIAAAMSTIVLFRNFRPRPEGSFRQKRRKKINSVTGEEWFVATDSLRWEIRRKSQVDHD
jgi:hypothetical protein